MLKELEKGQNLEQNTNFNINRCFNVIRAVFETDFYVVKYHEKMEQTIHPVLNFLENSSTIDFDDDVGQIAGSIMKITKNVSDTCKVLFPLTPQIHAKYKGIFGNLIQALNYYIKEGHAWLAEDKSRVEILHNMCMDSIFYNN